MSKKIHLVESGEALTASAAAQLCSVSVRHWWSLNAQGKTPRPIRLSRSVRWLRSEIIAWLAAGAPPRDTWEARRREIRT